MQKRNEATVADVLREAALEIDDGHWIQGAFARDLEGKDVGILDPKACSFCMYGAIGKALHETLSRNLRLVVCDHLNRYIFNRFKADGIIKFNDSVCRTGEQASRVLRDAADDWEERNRDA